MKKCKLCNGSRVISIIEPMSRPIRRITSPCECTYTEKHIAVGDVYERDIHDGHVWKIERRLILDVTDQCILYQILHDEVKGTCVDHDYIKDQKQATMKEWKTWVKLARKV